MSKHIMALLLALAWAAPVAAENLQSSDFSYVGAFALPEGFAPGARGMTYRQGGNNGAGSLIVLGRLNVRQWAEVSIPTPARGSYDSAPVAQFLTRFVGYDGDLMAGATDIMGTYPGDVECIPARGRQTSEKCYWTAEYWYDVTGDDYRAIGMSDADGSNPRGMWHVGPFGNPIFHGTRHGSYLFEVPSWFADRHLGGRSLMCGMTRESGANGSSQGPTLFAFRPWDSDNPPARADLDALALVYYPEVYPGCAGPNVGDPSGCAFPGYRACDAWVGAAFVESGSRSAVVLLGVKSMGENRYGQGRSGDCMNDSQGYHCDPYQAQLIFYSTTDLAESAAGRREPSTVVPYASWHPDEFMDTRCPEVGAVAVDRAGGRFFAVENGWGDGVVHVYSLASAASRGGGDGASRGGGQDARTGADQTAAHQVVRPAACTGCCCRTAPMGREHSGLVVLALGLLALVGSRLAGKAL